MDFSRRRIFAPPRPVLLRPARSPGGLFSEGRRSVRRKKAAFPPKNFAWIPPHGIRPYVLKSMRLGSAYFGFCLTRFFSTR